MRQKGVTAHPPSPKAMADKGLGGNVRIRLRFLLRKDYGGQESYGGQEYWKTFENVQNYSKTVENYIETSGKKYRNVGKNWRILDTDCAEKYSHGLTPFFAR